MPYSGPHTLVTVSGTSWGIGESWTFGMRFSGSPALTQAMADATGAAAKAWFTAANSGYRTEQSVTHVKVAPIGPDGKYPVGLDAVEANIISGQGTFGSGFPPPNQIATVMTFTTAIPRGIAHNTRAYLPGICDGLQGGLYTVANATTRIAAFRTFLLALNGVGYGSCTVMSKKYGIQRTVTGLSLGLVPDTMRSRRRSLPETPVLLAL